MRAIPLSLVLQVPKHIGTLVTIPTSIYIFASFRNSLRNCINPNETDVIGHSFRSLFTRFSIRNEFLISFFLISLCVYIKFDVYVMFVVNIFTSKSHFSSEYTAYRRDIYGSSFFRIAYKIALFCFSHYGTRFSCHK